MHNNKALLGILLLSASLWGSCSPSSPIASDNDNPIVNSSTFTVTDPEEMACYESATSTLKFKSPAAWTATITSGSDWLTLSSLKGEGSASSQQSITLTALSGNETNAVREACVTLKSGTTTKEVTVTQRPAFIFKQTEYQVGIEGDTVQLEFTSDANSDELMFASNADFKDMAPSLFKDDEQAQTRAHAYGWRAGIPIVANTSKSQRFGELVFYYKNTASVTIKITQAGTNSTQEIDKKNDGVVKHLQTHSEGAGIPVVLLGDGFQNSDIEDGTYDSVMDQAMKYFFSVEPMTTFRSYFDVYSVSAVSADASFGDAFSTAFSSKFGEGTEITGDNDKCQEYAKLAISQSQLNQDGLIIVVLNSPHYAGTCVLYHYKIQDTGYNALSIAYVTMPDGSDPKNGGIGFEQVLHHEANGHGFGKLADEYDTGSAIETIDAAGIADLNDIHSYGLSQNVDVHANVTQTLWSKLAADSRYAAEELGAYEGAYTYKYGVFRPTVTSIMNDNQGVFNAPSREAIYKRIMYIAKLHKYTYSYDDFTEYDAANRTTATKGTSRAGVLLNAGATKMPPLGKPKVIEMK